MPRIFDNIDQQLLTALQETLNLTDHADFCVGYFNLRGWKQLDSYIEQWSGGEGHCCRLLVGMQRLPEEELRAALSLIKRDAGIDNQTAQVLKKKLAEEFRNQLTIGIPTNDDESGLRRLAAQIKSKKVIVKLYLRHPLHAKLYLLFRPDPISPTIGYLGSSNLTLAGLSRQGELNVDVLDHDACQKLSRWFEDRWNDRWCLDISDELVKIIEESWAREELLPPYYIYVKMAYHLSQEARSGLSEFRIPRDFGNKLFEFQTAAVKIAAHHLNKRGGVLIGDVVGLGKTLMATALARIFEDDHGLETLIICPKNLIPMWEDYRDQYRLRARVLSISRVINELPALRRYRIVLIDESHNLRNREGKRYRAIQEYIRENESKCVLLSATPYNKTYLDLGNQLRLFVEEDKDIGVRPERLLRELGDIEFTRRYQCSHRSLAAFEKSEYPDDWRELMRLYLVRRTRSFIQENYAETEPDTGRQYLTFEDGSRSYFPVRQPKTVKFEINDADPHDQYARLYASDVVDTINALSLPRYGLGNYLAASPHDPPTQAQAKVIQDLSRAGKRLMGFCRTNLFKRLESGGQAFIQSVERHILRNYVFLHAIERGLPLPIGTQDAGLLDARIFDEDADAIDAIPDMFDENDSDDEKKPTEIISLRTEEDFRKRAADIYMEYAQQYRTRFKWLRPNVFIKTLGKDLHNDAGALLKVLQKCGEWNADQDTKLSALANLLIDKHPSEKVIIFTQFADTVRYLEYQLKKRGINKLAGVTGDSPDPTALAWRFSPESNEKRQRISAEDELRVLTATDVLSEGQNLQDCAVVVNYDLPWAIIRLIQRAGRVDRIGQKSENILCYSFLPADGVERLIGLRARVRKRLQENAEVVGTDEAFFEDDRNDQVIVDLYNESAGILDGDIDSEVDLASYAYQIWKNAITRDPKLQKIIAELPNVCYATKEHKATEKDPAGVLVYLRTAEGNDALVWVDKNGKNVTESQLSILKAAECVPDTPALNREQQHHELVKKGVELIIEEEKSVGGELGRPSGARYRTYERLMRYAQEIKGTLFESQDLLRTIDDIYRYPLRPSATDTLNRQLRSGISDETLAQLVMALRDEGRLCSIHEEEQVQEPRIICSMGLSDESE
ncbi:MAG TPA: NgoFVII family restriction endonuclease [Syntrophaceae bacterium]|jgi:hypothetical protein|nr:NgoFVII family restriction endonuclease [Syntrophaceae bacterium]